MLPTFVIGLREGLEAALIVGIIAAFLRKQGRRDLLRWVFVGVGTAIGLCLAAGIALNVLSKDLPQRQQEGLETVIGVLAVGMVTYMVVWMKRNSRGLKGQLEGMAAERHGRDVARSPRDDRDGLPRRTPRGHRDRRLPARRVQRLDERRGRASRRSARHRRGGRARVRDLPRRRPHQPVEVLPCHRSGARAGRRRAGRERAPDGARGGLDRHRPGPHRRSELAGRSRVGAGLAAHRDARPAEPTRRHRGPRLAAVPDSGRGLRRLPPKPPGRSVARRTVSRVLLASGAVLAVGTVALAIAAPATPARGATTATASGPLVATVSGHRADVTEGHRAVSTHPCRG